MLRKLKFGLNFNEIIINPLCVKKTVKNEEDSLVKCSIFRKKCKIKWCKNEITVFNFHVGHNIPRSKGGSLNLNNLVPICSNCIEQCKVIRLRNTVRFKYTRVVRRNIWGVKIKKTFYRNGRVKQLPNNQYNSYNILCDGEYFNVNIKNILYKLNTCPWCRSHRLRDWHKNSKKFSKTKTRQKL